MISVNAPLYSIGTPPWTLSPMLASLDEFQLLFKDRPIQHNIHGMRAPSMFAAWFMARAIRPTRIIESGVFRGQGTWMLERACPSAEISCLDIDMRSIRYRSNMATYFEGDFNHFDWSRFEPSSTLLFFDDHYDAVERLAQCAERGFKHLVFESNYPVGRGDHRSVKQVLQGEGGALRERLQNTIEIYAEFPPVFKPKSTRWGDAWDDRYPTHPPLLKPRMQRKYRQCWWRAKSYTWICYIRLKDC